MRKTFILVLNNEQITIMRKILVSFIAILTLNIGMIFSQENEEKSENEKAQISVGADFVSRYVWRGQQFGNASVQPSMNFSKSGFGAGFFGSASLMGNSYDALAQEADININYTFKEIITINAGDYFFPIDFSRNKYFEYGKDSTGHIFELGLSFNGTEKIPFSFLIATSLYGADTRKANGDLNYSTYSELKYNKNFNNTEISAFAGASLTTPGDNLTSFYGNTDPAIVNLGITLSQKIKITDKYSLPVFGSFITNPEAESVWLIFGISISN